MKHIAIAVLSIGLMTISGFGQNYQHFGSGGYQYGHMDRFGHYYQFDTNGNYSFGTVEPNTGNYYNYNSDGSYSFGHIWQDPD